MSPGWPIRRKIFPPERLDGVIDRERLVSRIVDQDSFAVCLVTAPAGYGKTHVLKQAYEEILRRGQKAVWLSIDSFDREPIQFLSYLVAAFDHAAKGQAGFAALSKTVAQGQENTSVKSSLNILVSQIQSFPACWVFLDDFHFAENPEIREIVDYLIAYLPPQIKLVVASRVLPRLHLTKLELQRALLRITQSELKFTREETDELLEGGAQDATLRVLQESTEGWPAALSLAAIWLKRNSDNSTNDHLVDVTARDGEVSKAYSRFLSEEIFESLGQREQKAISMLAAFSKFSQDLISHAIGEDTATTIFDRSGELFGLLIPLDDQNVWWRLHPLLAEFVKDQRIAVTSDALERMHIAASNWFNERGGFFEAIEHAQAAEDGQQVIALIERMEGWKILLGGGIGTLRGILEDLPDEQVRQSNRVAILKAYLFTKSGAFQQAQRLLKSVAARLDESPQANDADRQLGIALSSMTITLNGYQDKLVTRKDFRQLEALIENVPTDDSLTLARLNGVAAKYSFELGELEDVEGYAEKSRRLYLQADCTHATLYPMFLHGVCLLNQADLDRARKTISAAHDYALANIGPNNDLTHIAKVLLAGVSYEQADMSECGRLLFPSIEHVAENDGWINVYFAGFETAIDYHFTTQSVQSASQVIELALRVASLRQLPRLRTFAIAKKAAWLAKSGDIMRAAELMNRKDMEIVLGAWRDKPAIWRTHLAVGNARAELARGRGNLGEAIEILEDLVELSNSSGRTRSTIKCLSIIACTLWENNARKKAVEELERAIALSSDTKLVRAYLDAGPSMRPLLEYSRDRVSDLRVRAAIEALEGTPRITHRPKLNQDQLLSSRELGVLQEVSRGLSDKEVARKLNISANTVNFHLKNIYKKFSVRNRKDAVTQGKSLNLIY